MRLTFLGAAREVGRRLVERRPRVRIWRVERDLRAHVEVLDSRRAHADRNDLLTYAAACGKGTRRIFLVHGELQAQQSLRAAMKARELHAEIPERGATVELL